MWIDNLSLAEACLGGEYSYGTILIVTGSFVQSKQLIQKLLGMPVRTLIWLKESVWTQEKSKIPVLNCGGGAHCVLERYVLSVQNDLFLQM